MENEFIFEMKDIVKAFGANLVLDGVSIAVKPGEVRAIMGENGAGKSTLMKVLGGIYAADQGTITIQQKPVEIRSVQNARNHGISFIHQEISNIPQMTVAENIFLGREIQDKFGFINQKTMKNEARKALDTVNLNIGVSERMADLSIAQQQMVEIARAVNEDAQIIIMDEPTACLTTSEVNSLFHQIRQLKAKGIAVLYISHRMEETFTICDSVTVLRDGKFIGTKETAKTNENELISMMVGREFDNLYGHDRSSGGDLLLEVKNLTSPYVKNVSFTLKKGEILGFAGLVGAGRTEMVKALFGIDPILGGEVFIEGKSVKISNPEEAMEAGIALVPEDRKVQGLILRHSIGANLTMQVLPSFIRNFRVNQKKEKDIVNTFKQKLSIRMASVDQLAGELSGGNQQKVVISKWLAASPKILILDEPTRGIDVGAKAEIYKLMHNLTQEGVSIIMVSSELPEVMNVSSRIAIMSEGELVKILDAQNEEITQDQILAYAIMGRNAKWN